MNVITKGRVCLGTCGVVSYLFNQLSIFWTSKRLDRASDFAVKYFSCFVFWDFAFREKL